MRTKYLTLPLLQADAVHQVRLDADAVAVLGHAAGEHGTNFELLTRL